MLFRSVLCIFLIKLFLADAELLNAFLDMTVEVEIVWVVVELPSLLVAVSSHVGVHHLLHNDSAFIPRQ